MAAEYDLLRCMRMWGGSGGLGAIWEPSDCPHRNKLHGKTTGGIVAVSGRSGGPAVKANVIGL